jgi:DNA-binding transcriptional LysR family regulator
MNIDLNKLTLFSRVYETGSVTRAAEALHITPSAVSQSLSHLEEDLGFMLFQRISKMLLPSKEADELYAVFRKTSKELEASILAGRSNKRVLSGTLKIGAPPEFGARQVVREASEFFDSPDARFELHFGLPDELIAKVVTQELDFAFCDSGPYLKKFEKLVIHQTVFEEEAVMVCSKSFYQKFVDGDHSYAHLSGLPHSDYRPDRKVLNLWYQHHFHKIPPKMNLRLAASNVNAMREAALHGLGLVFIPTHLIANELKSGKLVAIPTKKSPYINPIVLVQKADKIPSHFEKSFILKFIRKN